MPVPDGHVPCAEPFPHVARTQNDQSCRTENSLTDKEASTLQVPQVNQDKCTAVATGQVAPRSSCSHLNHTGLRDTQETEMQPDHVSAVLTLEPESGSVRQGSLRPPSGQGVDITYPKDHSMLCQWHQWGLEKGPRGPCQARPSPDALVCKVTETR